jgi:hypothetical protein
MQAKASMMIQPEMLPDIPTPVQAPERIFIEPMKVMPGMVSQPVQQSTWAPMVAGFTSAAGQIGSAAMMSNAYNYQSRLNVPSTAGSVGIQGFQIQGSLL